VLLGDGRRWWGLGGVLEGWSTEDTPDVGVE
jgi:hypothetical protein